MSNDAVPPLLMEETDEPIVLVGPPRSLLGEFHLHNPTDEKVIVREPRLRAVATPEGADARRAALLQQPSRLMRRIVMRPGRSRHVPLSLSLHPHTPPGTYHAALDINGRQRAVVMHVTEEVSLTFAPEELVLPNRAGEAIEKRVVFRNEGNVPVSVRSIGAVVLDEELVHCRALRGALADVGDKMTKLDDFVVALGHRYRQLYETLTLKVKNTATTLQPGATQAIDLTIGLPDKLEPRSRYRGYAALSTSSLLFTVVPN